MFEPHLSEFFVDAGDAEFTRKLKLEILTNVANEGNISRILREFKEYVRSEDKAFVTATIQVCFTSFTIGPWLYLPLTHSHSFCVTLAF